MQCSRVPLRLLGVTARRLLLGLLAATISVACQPGGLHPRPTTPEPPLPAAKRLGGSSWNISPAGTRPGEPFEVDVITTSLEVINNTNSDVSPVCVLTYGSQVAVIETGDTVLPPSDRAWLTGTSEFLRPLDDYESSDAACYTRLPASIARQLQRERRLLTVGRTTRVPNLLGESVDSRLASFCRGLDISIIEETTPCSEDRLMEMSRFVDPFGGPACADPVIGAQHPEPGSSATVGDEISVTVVPRVRSAEQRDAK